MSITHWTLTIEVRGVFREIECDSWGKAAASAATVVQRLAASGKADLRDIERCQARLTLYDPMLAAQMGGWRWADQGWSLAILPFPGVGLTPEQLREVVT